MFLCKLYCEKPKAPLSFNLSTKNYGFKINFAIFIIELLWMENELITKSKLFRGYKKLSVALNSRPTRILLWMACAAFIHNEILNVSILIIISYPIDTVSKHVLWIDFKRLMIEYQNYQNIDSYPFYCILIQL